MNRQSQSTSKVGGERLRRQAGQRKVGGPTRGRPLLWDGVFPLRQLNTLGGWCSPSLCHLTSVRYFCDGTNGRVGSL
jgi:hypothetical protein